MERKRKRTEEEEGRKMKEQQRLEEEENGRKRAKKYMEEREDVEVEADNGEAGPSYAPHRKSQPATITLTLPVEEFRAEFSQTANRRNLTLRGQTDHLSDMVLRGGGDLKDFPCSTSTMSK